MKTGNFYFIKDSYFIDFPDKYLEQNKETIDGKKHSRPCFYGFKDEKYNIYWMIPFSSKVDKYKQIHLNNVKKYGQSDTIIFGYFLSNEKAFLIQNMFPIIEDYIENVYVDSDKNPIKISFDLEKLLIQKAKIILTLVKRGNKRVFPNVIDIENKLKRILNNE